MFIVSVIIDYAENPTCHERLCHEKEVVLVGSANDSPQVQGPIVARQAEALRLRIEGLSYQQIADRLGYESRNGPHAAVKSALELARADRLELAGEVLDLQIARYEELFSRNVQALDEMEAEGREVGRAALFVSARGYLDSLSRLYGVDRPSAVVTVRTESGLNSDLARLAEFVAGVGDDADDES
ncbi:MAG: hypothetical protein QM658_03175 [Gordonia sp. (in: high G+C Gram-positive bacteria)]